LISWKYSFEEISKDLELAKKKKQALEDLYSAGKISESTYESLNSDIGHTITEIEKRQKALAEKMTSKLTDLEKQINTLEIFLANSEIQHVAGEIDDELHERESKAFGLGLDALRQQLDSIKGIVGDILPEAVAPPPSEPEETAEAAVEMPTTEEIAEEKAETPVEAPSVEETPVEVTEEIAGEQPTETPEETETVSEEMTAEEPVEIPTEEIEEQAPSPEEVVEEPEATHELAVEEEVDEAATEEEMETPTEEASYEQEEEVAEEETEW